ncbi:MAG: hypothetical protein AAF908_00215 [Pseudomonadota bacterium]
MTEQRTQSRDVEAGIPSRGPLSEDILNALTAIRSSAEVLRDFPEIDPRQQRRFVEIVLAEEARLEALMPGLMGPGRRP